MEPVVCSPIQELARRAKVVPHIGQFGRQCFIVNVDGDGSGKMTQLLTAPFAESWGEQGRAHHRKQRKGLRKQTGYESVG